jgi:hypothetical protein
MPDSRRLLWIQIILFFSLLFCLPTQAFSSWPDFPLSSDCFLGGAQGTQTTSSVAFDGANFLVVWEDERINTQRDIFGVRVSLQGDILDPIGIPICTYPGAQSYANVAWGGQNYLVVWQDWRNENWAIYGARVSPDGNVLDPDGFLIAGETGWSMCPAVASDGINFFVVWSWDKYGISYDLYGTRVTPQGEVLDTSGILICETPIFEDYPSIAYNGSIYLVAWEHDPG